MKKLSIIICLFGMLAINALARLGSDQIQLARGNFEVPAIIDKITNMNELEPFLTATREFSEHLANEGYHPTEPHELQYYDADFLRTAAVRKLGELMGSKAVERLLDVFYDEPISCRGLPPFVRLEVVRTLGRVGGKEAKDALMDLFNSYWGEVDNILLSLDEMPMIYNDVAGEFATLVHAMLGELRHWSGDEDVHNAARNIVDDLGENTRKALSPLKRDAVVLYMEGRLAQTKLEGENAVEYLLTFYEEKLPDHRPDSYTADWLLSRIYHEADIEFHKAAVALLLLYEIDDNALLAAKDAIQRDIAKQYMLLYQVQSILKDHVSRAEGNLKRQDIYTEQQLKETAVRRNRYKDQLHAIEKLTKMQPLQKSDYSTLFLVTIADQRDKYLWNDWQDNVLPLIQRASVIEKVLHEKTLDAENTHSEEADL